MAVSFADLTRKALTPLVVVCLLAALGSAAMILQAGHWRLLWLPSLAIMVSPVVFPLVLFPAAFFTGVMQAAGNLYPKVARLCLLLTFGWFISVLAAYQFGIYHLGAGLLEAPNPLRLPMLVWTISIAVLPWAIFATRDRANVLFTGIVYMMVVAALITVPSMVFYALPFWWGYGLFCGVMAALLSLQALYERLFMTSTAAKPTDAPVVPVAENAPADTSDKSGS